MPLYAASHWLADSGRFSNISKWHIVATLLFYAGRMWAIGSPPQVPREIEQDLRGRLIVIVNAFSPLAFSLFTRLAVRGAQLIALSENPSDSREQQLLRLVQDETSNAYLYMERWDPERPEDFAKEWETKGSKRAGALGEAIGRKMIYAVIRFPSNETEARSTLALFHALEASLTPRSPDTPDGLMPGGIGEVRLITVVPSPLYAAAAASPNAPVVPAIDKLTWRDEARLSLNLIHQTAVSQDRFDSKFLPDSRTNRLVNLCVSTGLTRQAIFSHMKTGGPNGSVFFWLKVVLFILLSPLVWFFGQSEGRAAQGIEWSLLAPLDIGQSDHGPNLLNVKGVRPGSFYRDGHRVVLNRIGQGRTPP